MITRGYSRPLVLSATAALLALAIVLAQARLLATNAATTPAAERDVPPFDSFRLLVDRNIFSSTRTPHIAGRETPAEAPPPAAAPATLRLMGTVVTDGQAWALFEGGAEAPRGGVKPGDPVAGYTVSAIRTNGITLAGSAGPVELAVGAGLAQQGDGSWKVVDASAVRSAEPTVTQESAESKSAENGSKEGQAAPSDDPVARMRERRKRELSNDKQ